MGYVGGPVSAACGDTQDIIRSLTAGVVAGSVLYAEIDVWGPYRGRYLAIFVGGVYQGCFFAPLIGNLKVTLPLTSGGTVGSIYIEDAGIFPNFDDDSIPSLMAEQLEALTAQRITMEWEPTYTISTPRNDSQLSSIAVTGAKRSVNCQAIPERPTRAKLSYSISNDSGDYTVSWYSGSALVATGTRTGNGALTCDEVGSSDLSVSCSITYSADIVPGIAEIEIRYPASYQIHLSTSSLSYPRVPEFSMTDTGKDSYVFQSQLLANGSWNYNVLEVDDDGDVQTTITAPADSPLVVNNTPASPTITSVSCVLSSGHVTPTVHWTVGESGCTYTVYSSLKNRPINYGTFSSPAPVITAMDATSAAVPNITDFSPQDNSTAFSTLESSFDSQASALASAFISGESGFSDVVASSLTALQLAIASYTDSIVLDCHSYDENVTAQSNGLASYESALSGQGLSTDDWQAAIGPTLAGYLAYLGSVLEGSAGRYVLSGVQANLNAPGVSKSLWDVAQPLVSPAEFQVVVRATKSGVQESQDLAFVFELDSTGALVSPRPADAHIQSIDITAGRTITATVSVFEEESAADSDFIDLYVVALGTPIDVTSPSASVSVSGAVAFQQFETISFTAPTNGHYQITALARTTAGSRSANYSVLTLYVANTPPPAVSGLSAKVIRGRSA